jgi:alkaline phosphatase D
MITLNEKQCRADYRIVPFVTKPGAPIHTHSSWVVEDGRRGVQKV